MPSGTYTAQELSRVLRKRVIRILRRVYSLLRMDRKLFWDRIREKDDQIAKLACAMFSLSPETESMTPKPGCFFLLTPNGQLLPKENQNSALLCWTSKNIRDPQSLTTFAPKSKRTLNREVFRNVDHNGIPERGLLHLIKSSFNIPASDNYIDDTSYVFEYDWVSNGSSVRPVIVDEAYIEFDTTYNIQAWDMIVLARINIDSMKPYVCQAWPWYNNSIPFCGYSQNNDALHVELTKRIMNAPNITTSAQLCSDCSPYY